MLLCSLRHCLWTRDIRGESEVKVWSGERGRGGALGPGAPPQLPAGQNRGNWGSRAGRLLPSPCLSLKTGPSCPHVTPHAYKQTGVPPKIKIRSGTLKTFFQINYACRHHTHTKHTDKSRDIQTQSHTAHTFTQYIHTYLGLPRPATWKGPFLAQWEPKMLGIFPKPAL